MRVVANLSLMFKSVPLLERYKLAKKCGFKLVELPFAYTESANALKKAADENGLQHILINTKNDENLGGLTCRKGYEDKFKENIQTTLEYADILGCSM
jgi:hydroxypyruvate isomerase